MCRDPLVDVKLAQLESDSREIVDESCGVGVDYDNKNALFESLPPRMRTNCKHNGLEVLIIAVS